VTEVRNWQFLCDVTFIWKDDDEGIPEFLADGCVPIELVNGIVDRITLRDTLPALLHAMARKCGASGALSVSGPSIHDSGLVLQSHRRDGRRKSVREMMRCQGY